MNSHQHYIEQLKALSAGIPTSLYRAAYDLYLHERYSESMGKLLEAFKHSGSTPSAYSSSMREGILLFAWNLHQSRKYEECLQFLAAARDKSLIGEDDAESELIRLWIEWSRGRYAEVIRDADARISELVELFDPLLAEYLYLRGSAHSFSGRLDEAIQDCEAAYVLFRLLGREKEQAETSNFVGIVLGQRSKYLRAIEWFKKSFEINRTFDLARKMGENLQNIGVANYKIGNYLEAYTSFQAVEQIADREGQRDLLCRAKIALGNVCRLRCEHEEARKHLMAAYTIATEQRLPREECLALEFLGDVFRDEGKPQEALRYYTRGQAIASAIAPEGDLIMELGRREGECRQLMDEVAKALPILAKARTLARKLGDRFEEGVILRCLAAGEAKISDWNSARQYISKSIALLEEVDARHELAISHLQAAYVYSAEANDTKQCTSPAVLLNDAWENALAAQHLFLKLDIEEWLEKSRSALSKIAKQRVTEARYRPVDIKGAPYDPPADTIIAVSLQMRNVLQLCDAFARYDEPVLITGETGTGKELIAKRIHQLSERRHKQLVALNAAAIPATMFEREFFGHHKGAFSGAESDQHGYAAAADGGTLFLDEIGELPLELQPKLLRLLQEGTYLALGNPEVKHADVRLIAATNANLKLLVDQGRFRPDLFYRLRILEIEIPPVYERPEDVVPLLNHFLSKSAGRPATVSEYFDEISIQAMLQHRWEGNVREIAMVARRAYICLTAEGRVRIELGVPPDTIWLTGPEDAARAAVAGAADKDILRSRIIVLLEETGGNRSETARRLGISRPTLYRWMARLGIQR